MRGEDIQIRDGNGCFVYTRNLVRIRPRRVSMRHLAWGDTNRGNKDICKGDCNASAQHGVKRAPLWPGMGCQGPAGMRRVSTQRAQSSWRIITYRGS